MKHIESAKVEKKCFVTTGVGFGSALLVNWIIPNEKGMLGLLFGYWLAVLSLGFLLRNYFKLTWLTTLLFALFPIAVLNSYANS